LLATLAARVARQDFCGFFNRTGGLVRLLSFSLLYRAPPSLLRLLLAAKHVFSTHFSPLPVVACFFGVAFMAACRVLMLFGSTMRLVRRWRLLLTARMMHVSAAICGDLDEVQDA